MEKINISYIILGLVFPYLLINFFLLKKFSIFQKKISLIDNDRWGNSNKSHLGGAIFFFNFCVSFAVYFYSNDLLNLNNIDLEQKKIIALFFAINIGFFSGLLDEIEVLPPFTKILTQFFASLFFIFGNIIISISGIYLIDIVLTSLFFIFLINIVNIFDNIDMGLAAPMSIIFLFFYSFGIDNFYSFMLIMMLLSLMVFMVYNFSPSKLFMGDLGSFQLGIILCFFLIEEIFTLDFLSFSHNANFFMNSLLLTLIIPLFIYDFIFVFFRRILKKENPFKGDANHLSHNLFRKFKSANLVSFIFVLIQTFSLLLALHIINHFKNPLDEILKIFTFHLLASILLYFLSKKITTR
jgi:UDP-GlcNAc:undecaprenyl-phosphate/decaprenyl-phosphate GlcNAc-1-phosphate transferase